MMVSEIIARWYKINARDLPWRKDSDPYKIWVSEIILQQTRVNQGINYFNRFIEEFPTVKKLADSSIDRVLKIWQGLGYYSRARNMHQTALVIVEKYNGVFPDNINELLKLRGIGAYSASALASIAYNKPHAAVDGNVYRILSRYYGIDIPINNAKGKKYFQQLADEILDKKNPGIHNQAIMEMGALVCTPAAPRCSECPMADNCIAFNNKSVMRFPVKSFNQRNTNRYFNYLVIRKGSIIFLKQRPEGDIWALLYEFPLIETKNRVNPENLMEYKQWEKFFERKPIAVTFQKEIKHQLSHQTIYINLIEVEVNDDFSLNDYLEVHEKDLDQFAFPVFIGKYLNK